MRRRHPRLIDEGIFEGPPAFRKAVEDWAVGLYAGHILAQVEEALKRERAKGKEQEDEFVVAERENAAVLKRIEADIRKLKKPGDIARWTIRDSAYSGSFTRVIGVKMSDFKRDPNDPGRAHNDPDKDGIPTYILGHSNPGKTRLKFSRYNFNTLETIISYATSRVERATDSLDRAKERRGPAPKRVGEPAMPRIIELELLRKAAAKLAPRAKKYTSRATKKFRIDPSDWRYIDTEADLAVAKLYAEKWGDIKVVLHFEGHKSRGGQWSWKGLIDSQTGALIAVERELQADVRNPRAYSLEFFEAGVAWIKEVVRHEVQHAGQDFLKAIKSLRRKGGIPGRKLSRGSYSQRAVKTMGDAGHALLDSEFYTDLADAVDDFMKLHKKVPKDMLSKLIKTFTAAESPYTNEKLRIRLRPNSHFSVWKRHDAAKWRKAVAEFIKEIQKRGVRLPGKFTVEGVRLRKPRLMETK